jgi:uncharacterized membrane protein
MKKNLEDTLYWIASHDASFFQILIGFMIVMVGLVITYYFGRAEDFHCVRTGAEQIRCDITQQLLGFQPLSERRVNSIQMAEVEESIDSQGDKTYRVIFVTPNGRVALTSYTSSDYTPKAELVHQVNDFITNDQQTILDVQLKIEWWKWLFFVGFTGLGLGMILVSLKKYLS